MGVAVWDGAKGHLPARVVPQLNHLDENKIVTGYIQTPEYRGALDMNTSTLPLITVELLNIRGGHDKK